MANQIEKECRQWNAERDVLRGYFVLSDKTKIRWRIYDDCGKWQWQQWGASPDRLGLTVDRLEEIIAEVSGQEVIQI